MQPLWGLRYLPALPQAAAVLLLPGYLPALLQADTVLLLSGHLPALL